MHFFNVVRDVRKHAQFSNFANGFKWVRENHTASGNYRKIPIPSGKKVVNAKLWDRPYLFEWAFENGNLVYSLYTIYNGNITIVSSQQTLPIDYVVVDE